MCLYPRETRQYSCGITQSKAIENLDRVDNVVGSRRHSHAYTHRNTRDVGPMPIAIGGVIRVVAKVVRDCLWYGGVSRDAGVDHVKVHHALVANTRFKSEIVSIEGGLCGELLLIDAVETPRVCRGTLEVVDVGHNFVCKVTAVKPPLPAIIVEVNLLPQFVLVGALL